MLVSDIITRVRNIAGDVDVLQFTDADIMRWINDGMRECAMDNDLLQKTATTTVTSGTSEYALPTDILRLHSVKYDNQKLPVLTLEEFDEQFTTDGSDTGVPINCLIWAGFVRLWPTPTNSVDELKIDYIRTPVDVTLAADTPDLPVGYHPRLVDYCLAQVAQQDDDLGRYQLKMDEFRSGVQKLKDQGESNADLYPNISVDVRDTGEGYWDYYG